MPPIPPGYMNTVNNGMYDSCKKGNGDSNKIYNKDSTSNKHDVINRHSSINDSNYMSTPQNSDMHVMIKDNITDRDSDNNEINYIDTHNYSYMHDIVDSATDVSPIDSQLIHNILGYASPGLTNETISKQRNRSSKTISSSFTAGGTNPTTCALGTLKTSYYST